MDRNTSFLPSTLRWRLWKPLSRISRKSGRSWWKRADTQKNPKTSRDSTNIYSSRWCRCRSSKEPSGSRRRLSRQSTASRRNRDTRWPKGWKKTYSPPLSIPTWTFRRCLWASSDREWAHRPTPFRSSAKKSKSYNSSSTGPKASTPRNWSSWSSNPPRSRRRWRVKRAKGTRRSACSGARSTKYELGRFNENMIWQ